MATGARVVGTTMLVLVLGLGGYAVADAYDVVPGVMTLDPVPADAAPFPTAPGAVEPDDVVPALGALDPQAPQPSADGVDALVDALVDDDRLKFSGVVVADQLTGQVLAEHRADVPRVPASTQKLVTAVAALGTLDGGAGVETRVVRGSGDQIVLVGGGDMMLAPDEGDPTLVDGHAGLGDLARAAAKRLKLAGLTEVTLLVDDTLFSGPSLHPTWTEGDLALGYVAPVTPLAVHIGATRTDVEYPPRYPDPTMAAAEVFADRLAEAGIGVSGDPRRGAASDSATTLASVTSAPLTQVVQLFLEHSDNTITEVVSRLVALDQGLPASFEGGTQAVLRAVARLGVDVTGATLADASGLADGSELTPQTLEQLVLLVMDPDEPALRPIAPGLPIGGLTGTLDDRYLESPARGLVRAKTGSLNGIKALAGTVVTADGRQLAFAVLTTHPVADGPWGARAAIDEFVTDLHECGCRG
ncbi:D-alanyl-D-alanine carboxypeptidase/D-alanyl-D-alanine-endopeptidase [Cellulomonas sp. DKR-3]|uniref:D-alanyl-D-alanine carboxypeptidase/D-alanyl-D-alanine-endopeptidase n=1 Tax=Cellulomonas fulva TaxID=2835530 RepID=A0ABS5TVQ0_9CELL|nr:D-alanyl-D-alanine carboxypeptidase/D-alanyl-D-alanine-endopeptidase [Cellulomonas fulva]MBT0993220.1 D-alanyl-D-alanine carboxypeptidase/D-alanyl-D-alanine-endopeptidase [Cellulomonas fulva]